MCIYIYIYVYTHIVCIHMHVLFICIMYIIVSYRIVYYIMLYYVILAPPCERPPGPCRCCAELLYAMSHDREILIATSKTRNRSHARVVMSAAAGVNG